MDISLPVGSTAHHPGPLARFIPPMEVGVIEQLLVDLDLRGSRLLDPFGVSPRVAIETAKQSCAVAVIANNPISRFVLEHTLHPFSVGELSAALALIASLPKDDTRMENFLLELYSSRCAGCGTRVSVDFFVWDKDLGGPSHKVYACDECGQAGEYPATEDDWERAQDYSRRGLHHAMAVEQIAPRGDPDRNHAEAALGAYPGRAIYAITTLLNKVQQIQIEPEMEAAVNALLLSAFEAGNSLWGYPDGRERPRQLVASQRYREFNLWRAMEEAIGIWTMDDPEVESISLESDTQLNPGRVHIFHGSYTQLTEILGKQSLDCLLSVPPRPNQAFWTLSALWAAWLWGQSAAAPIKVALRRRRYDWAWHAGALHTVIRQVSTLIKPPKLVALYLPESEPGFIAALFSSFDAAGFDLKGRALRAHEGQAAILWERGEQVPGDREPGFRRTDLSSACLEVLEQRCEPASFPVVHAAAWSYLSKVHYPRSQWDSDVRQVLQVIGDHLDEVLNDQRQFDRFGRGVELEAGLYWIAGPSNCGLSLFDRVEKRVLEELRAEQVLRLDILDRKICKLFQGLQTPGKRLILTALQSYAEITDQGSWVLRPEDHAGAREDDRREIHTDLIQLGQGMGFEIEADDLVTWRENGQVCYRFLIRETAVLGDIGLDHEDPLTLVLPGGRASLLTEKSRRDPRIRDWLQTGTRVLKFRHVRRLVSESTLTRDNLTERMAIDPPEHQDPQLPLL